MSDTFTVVLDLSRVKNDKKKDHLYLAMADTTKMKMIYEFKLYIRFLFSLDCPVELFCEGARLPDLEDIRVLSRLEVIQVIPVEHVKEEEYEGMGLISKSKECSKEHGDGEPKPMAGDSVAKYNDTDYQGNVWNLKSLETGEIVQTHRVPGFGAHERAQMLCGPSFPASDRACNEVQNPKDNLMRKAYNMQESKTLKLGGKTGIAENLKIGTMLQNRYYGWCEKSGSNTVTGRSHFDKSNEAPDFKLGEKPCFFKSNAKCDVDGVENKAYIPNYLKPGDVNISKGTFEEPMWSPVNMKEAKNHELCDGGPPACEIWNKSCSRSRPDPHSGPCGSHVIPGTVQKPLTGLTGNTPEKKSFAGGNFPGKPLSVEEALKILTEAAAERSKTLSGNKPASQNAGKKNQFGGACKSFKAAPTGGSGNFQKGNVKHQTASKNSGSLDKDGLAQVILDGYMTKPAEWQCQFLMPKLEMKSKVNKKAGSGHKNQGSALVKGCEKLDQNQGRKSGSNGKVMEKSGAPNPPPQFNPAQKKKRTRKRNKTKCENQTASEALLRDSERFDNNHRNDKSGGARKTDPETSPSNPFREYGNAENKIGQTETGDKSQGKASVKGSKKIDNCHGQKAGSTGMVELKPGELESLLQGNVTKKKPKANNPIETADISEVNSLFKGCIKIDENQGRKTEKEESTGEVGAKTGVPNPLQCDPAQKKKRTRKRNKTKCENQTASEALLRDSERFDNNHCNDKSGGARKTDPETSPSNPFLEYGNAENKIGQGYSFGEIPTSWSAFLGESAGFEKSPSRGLHSPRGDSEPGVRFLCRSPDDPTVVGSSVKDPSDFRFPGSDARSNPRRDLGTTDRALGKEDGDRANVSNPPANSFRNFNFSGGAVTQDVAASLFPDLKQGKCIVGDDISPKDNDKDKNESQSEFPATNRVTTPLNKIADNASVKDTEGVNVSDNAREAKLVPSPGQADLMRNQSRDGFGAVALSGVGTGSTRIGGADSDSSGSRYVQKNAVIDLPYRSVLRAKQEPQDLHGQEGSGRDKGVEHPPSSSGQSANVSTGNDSGSDKKKKDLLPYAKECVIALVMIITALAF